VAKTATFFSCCHNFCYNFLLESEISAICFINIPNKQKALKLYISGLFDAIFRYFGAKNGIKTKNRHLLDIGSLVRWKGLEPLTL